MLVSPFQDRHNPWIRIAKLVENLSKRFHHSGLVHHDWIATFHEHADLGEYDVILQCNVFTTHAMEGFHLYVSEIALTYLLTIS